MRRRVAAHCLYSRRILHGPASELFLCLGSHAGRLLGGRTECAYAPSTLDFFSPHPQGRRRGSPFARVGLCGFVCLSVGRTVGRRRWAHTRGNFPLRSLAGSFHTCRPFACRDVGVVIRLFLVSDPDRLYKDQLRRFDEHTQLSSSSVITHPRDKYSPSPGF